MMEAEILIHSQKQLDICVDIMNINDALRNKYQVLILSDLVAILMFLLKVIKTFRPCENKKKNQSLKL